jgi:hypothetical protein
LWKLVRDDAFLECLGEMVTSDNAILKQVDLLENDAGWAFEISKIV